MIPQYIGRRPLPTQDFQKVMTLSAIWQRLAAAHESWATQAKQCVDFAEGRQWSEQVLRKLAAQGRPHLKVNKIAPLVRLVHGYFTNNRSDSKALPGHDGTGDEITAEAISNILKQIAEASDEPYVDAAVFLDGITSARGYYDTRLDYSENVLGEARTSSLDPFTVYMDPDATDYNLDKAGVVAVSRMMSIDEVEYTYGPEAAQLTRPFLHDRVPLSPVNQIVGANGEITPVRGFGNRDDSTPEWWDTLHNALGWDFVDPYRKSFRVMDFQYWLTNPGKVFVDLETGDKAEVPNDWSDQDIQKALYHAESVGNPLRIIQMPIRKVRWTTMIADILVYDDWSQYDGFTIQGFFPYFRRGHTRGMVEDLIDPQKEINRRRSAEIEIVTRAANGGWKVHSKSMSVRNKKKLETIGSRPGAVIEWDGEPHMEPKEIGANTQPVAHERLEQKAQDDVRQVAGINESALGEMDRVQSGRALEARLRQAVIAIQMYMDNMTHTKKLVGKRKLNIVQRHYKEPRIFRILGENGRLVTTMINAEQIDPMLGATQIVNDVTRGKYQIVVNETPLSATFLQAQFEEFLMMMDKLQGVLPPQFVADILIDLSSLPRKEEIKQRIQQALLMAPPPTEDGPGGGGEKKGGKPGAQQPGNAPSLAQGTAPGGNIVPIRPAGPAA